MSQFTHTHTATTIKGLFPHLHTHTNTHKHTLALVARLLSFSASMSHSPSINIPTDKALANHSLCTAYQPSLMGIYSACLCVCVQKGWEGEVFGSRWHYMDIHVFWKILFLAKEICRSNFFLSPNDSALVPAQKGDRLILRFFFYFTVTLVYSAFLLPVFPY